MRRLFGLMLAVGAVAGCGGSSDNAEKATCPVGSKGCPCYGNGSCDGALSCVSDVCVDLDESGGAGGEGSGDADATPALLTNGFYYACEGSAEDCESWPSSQTYDMNRFYDDGTVIGAALQGGPPDQQDASWFNPSHAGVQMGTYTLEGTSLAFAVNSLCSYSGTVGVKTLMLRITCPSTGNQQSLTYDFVPAASEAGQD